MFKIVTIPSPVLNQPVQAVTQFDDKLKKIVLEMEETLVRCVDPQGVGLAAPQVGLSIALFIIKPEPTAETQVFINPKILSVEPKKEGVKPKKKDTQLEGCLSIPRIWSPVFRSKKITLAYQDITGKSYEKEFRKFDAIIIQHEVDHLQGILFTQRAVEQNVPLFEEKGDDLKRIDF